MKDEQKMRKLGVNKMQTEIQSKVEEEKNGFDANGIFLCFFIKFFFV